MFPIFSSNRYYPPGHGDFYQSFFDSGVLDELINEGRKYCFMSNIDNMGATVDLNILAQCIQVQIGGYRSPEPLFSEVEIVTCNELFIWHNSQVKKFHNFFPEQEWVHHGGHWKDPSWRQGWNPYSGKNLEKQIATSIEMKVIRNTGNI